jgi:tol-pal system protein YbgF
VKGPALCLVLVAGCTSQVTQLRQDNRRLQQTVSELRADRRTQDRKLRDVQKQLDLARAQIVSSTFDGPDAAPNLPVEIVGPPADPASDPHSRVVGITEDGEEIVYEGDAAAGKVATLESDPLPARSAPPPPPPRVAVTRRARPSPAPTRREQPTERGGEAASEYRAAVELVRTGQHDRAVTALRAFIANHPRHDYADNAQYWLGEAFYATKDFARALIEFRAVIETYPRGNKVPDALLKVGYCYQAMGQTAKARAVLEQVVNLYPKTEPAALAAKRLEAP